MKLEIEFTDDELEYLKDHPDFKFSTILDIRRKIFKAIGKAKDQIKPGDLIVEIRTPDQVATYAIALSKQDDGWMTEGHWKFKNARKATLEEEKLIRPLLEEKENEN